MLVSKVSRKQMKKTSNVEEHEHCLYLLRQQRLDELTGDSKYVDRHGAKNATGQWIQSIQDKLEYEESPLSS